MNTNPLLNCDAEKGICEIIDSSVVQTTGNPLQNLNSDKISIVYFTDPICSSCWGIEAQLRKLKLEYGNVASIDYRMGGLLPSWDIYNSGGIGKPSDVAGHWEEVSPHYKMPIDGGVWLKDPLHSSYPPSVAFKAAQMQDRKKAISFLRILREMVFLDQLNICKIEHLENAATRALLDVKQWREHYETTAESEFNNDLQLARQLGVRGFPTLFFVKGNAVEEILYGFKSYEDFEKRLKKMDSDIKKIEYSKDWDQLFAIYPTLTTQEFAVLSEISFEESKEMLLQLERENKIQRQAIKNGDLWILNTSFN